MVEKKKVGMYLPTEVVDVYEALQEGLRGNEKWLVGSAAIITLLSIPESERMELFSRIKSADLPGRNLRDLIEEARKRPPDDEPDAHGDPVPIRGPKPPPPQIPGVKTGTELEKQERAAASSSEKAAAARKRKGN